MKKTKQQLELAKFILNECTMSFGLFEELGVDTAVLFLDEIKNKLGMFEKEVRSFLNLLEGLQIVDKIQYVEAAAMSPKMTGFAFECEVSMPRLREYIKKGGNEETMFDEDQGAILYKFYRLPISRDTKQYYFCKSVYRHKAHERISWDEIYETMTGDNETTKGKWKVVYDVMTEINKKAKEELGIEELFRYQKHEFIRLL